MLTLSALLFLALFATTPAHSGQKPFDVKESDPNEWFTTYGPQFDQPFTGFLSFSHLPYARCINDADAQFDLAILGMPFDTAVSYRSGARYGPFAIRSGSRRQRPARGYTTAWDLNPYLYENTTVMDCGDVPITPFDNLVALDMMEAAYSTLLNSSVANNESPSNKHFKKLALDGVEHPRIISLGGDHTIVLPILRSLHKIYGPVSVIHFDAHLDTWITLSNGKPSPQENFNHGTPFYKAFEEGLLTNNCIHAGIRCKLESKFDLDNDDAVGFQRIKADAIYENGVDNITQTIVNRVGTGPVYISLDIDTIDPGMAPASTPETGGWTTREVKRIIRGLRGLNIVGADVVEVSPAFDTAEITGIAAADIVHDFLSLMVLSGKD